MTLLADDHRCLLLQDAGVSAAQRSPFHGMRSPPIGIGAYMERIAKYAKCSPVCFVMAEAYMERLAEVHCCAALAMLHLISPASSPVPLAH